MKISSVLPFNHFKSYSSFIDKYCSHRPNVDFLARGVNLIVEFFGTPSICASREFFLIKTNFKKHRIFKRKIKAYILNLIWFLLFKNSLDKSLKGKKLGKKKKYENSFSWTFELRKKRGKCNCFSVSIYEIEST